MDDDSLARAKLNKDLEHGKSTFDLVCDHLEVLQGEYDNRKALIDYSKGKSNSNSMDLSQVGPGRTSTAC